MMGDSLFANPRSHARVALPLLIAIAAQLGCDVGSKPPAPKVASAVAGKKLDRDALRKRAAAIFGTLPKEVTSPDNPISEEKIALGRMLYYDKRLSKNQDISCNSCHPLDRYGEDSEVTSPGHGGKRGERNTPTVYNAALHVAQFWDGRAPDVEAQAMGPVMNPAEMAMPSEEHVVALLASIPGYRALFRAAFPEDEQPISFENMARAIGAFERRLMTPSAFDAFLAGDDSTVTDAQLEGLSIFMQVGCTTCHLGPGIGGSLYRKLGVAKAYGTEDPGRFAVTGNELDRGVFKVPSLRNVTQTAPYFHDGSIAQLEDAIRIMGEHQLGQQLTKEQITSIRAFLRTLAGRIDPLYTARPKLPESGPETPAPDPS
jgi:cytochrome c peroxidase